MLLAFFVGCSLLCIWLYIRSMRKTKQVVLMNLKSKRNKGELEKMRVFLNDLTGKRCVVHTIDGEYDGILEKVEEDFIFLKDLHNDSLVFVNLEYVVGIVEKKSKPKKEKAEVVEEAKKEEI